MVANRYQVRLCRNQDCQLRYPLVEGHPYGYGCPRCGGDTRIIHTRALNLEPKWHVRAHSKPTFSVLLENVRSAWNVGSMIRTADSVGIKHLYLSGITPTPRSKKVLKTSLGAECTVSWSHHNNAVTLVQELKEEGYRIWALENSTQSESIFNAVDALSRQPLVLVVGNEVCGVDPDILQQSDMLVAIPMRGMKKSLNAAVAFGIAAAVLAHSGGESH